MEEDITDHYGWVKGYYEKPDSYNNSDTILWDQVEGSEWIEVTVNGAVQNLNLVTLKQNDAQDKLISDEILYHLDSVENQTVLVKATQSEGIPSEARQDWSILPLLSRFWSYISFI